MPRVRQRHRQTDGRLTIAILHFALHASHSKNKNTALLALEETLFTASLQIYICCVNRLQCFKSAWMMAVLHDALGFPLNYHWLTSAHTVKGHEVHWSLGALLYKTKYFPLR